MTKKISRSRVVKAAQKRGGYSSSSKSVTHLKPPPAGAAPGGVARIRSGESAQPSPKVPTVGR